MIRIFTYITVNAIQTPTAFGTYFDPVLADLNVVPGDNSLIQSLRNGTELRISDPQLRFENRGTLMIGSSHVDLESTVTYLGNIVYLGSVLYHHFKNDMPVVIHMQSGQLTHPKAYVCYLRGIDEALEAAATEDTTDQLFLTRMNSPKVFNFPLYIHKTGRVIDYDDPLVTLWEERH